MNDKVVRIKIFRYSRYGTKLEDVVNEHLEELHKDGHNVMDVKVSVSIEDQESEEVIMVVYEEEIF